MARTTGQVIPALQTRVRPLPHLVFYWNAFFNLTTERSSGFGLGPVPWSAIDGYARRYQVTDEAQFDVLVRFIRAMDATLLEDFAERSKSPEK